VKANNLSEVDRRATRPIRRATPWRLSARFPVATISRHILHRVMNVGGPR
jgi:hypothetical protein